MTSLPAANEERSRSIPLEILYRGLIDVRAFSSGDVNGSTENSYRISDLLHNVPLAIKSARSEGDYEKILNDLASRATLKNMDGWLQTHLTQIEERAPQPD